MNAPIYAAGSPEWLQERRGYLGATDIAAIAGKHKYRTALGVYAEKALGIVDDSQSVMAKMGIALEPVVKWVAERDLKASIAPGPFLRHSVYPFLAANLDGVIPGVGVAEFKTHGFSTRDEWGEEMTDEVPDAYHVQGTWYCGMSGEPSCIMVAFDRDKGTARYYRIEANPDFFETLVSIGVEFWNDHVLAKIEPIATEASDLDVVRRIYGTQESELTVSTDAHDVAAEKYIEWKDLISKAEKERDGYKAELIQAIGPAAGIVTAHGNFTYKARKDGVRVFRAPGA